METEKRLIDAYALMDCIRDSKRHNPHDDPTVAKNHMFEHNHFMKMVILAPTVNAVEVVRCKDCYHNEQCICVCCEDGEMIKCGLHHKHMDANGYCHEGRRC